MDDLNIRRATLDDAPQLAACFDDAYATYAQTIPDLPDVSAGIRQDISSNSVWVAEKGRRIIGGAILSLDGADATLVNIAVVTSARGTGLGRMLLSCVEDACRRWRVQRITLSTHVKMPQNLALYAYFGWREVGRSGSKVHMEKQL